MDKQVSLTVDGIQMHVPSGTLLWEACKAHGIDIPIFCYHTKLGPVGACRTCLVEVEGMTKGPITACSTPVTDGMVVRTRSPLVAKAQRGIFEFLLLNHPLDCPICDKGGECPLQDQTFAYGPGSSRYVEPKRHHVKPIALGPTVALDRERCVLCWRCVRFCSEIAEDNSIVLLDRGDHTVVGTFQDEPYVSNFSGNVIELCPVGALTSRKQRFNFRPWELQNRPSVCPHCPMGCNINMSVRKNDEVIRFLSRDNPDVDDSWLCDRGRFGIEFINSPERLTLPLVRQGDAFVESTWSDALQIIAERLQQITADVGADSIVGIASPRLTNEDLFVFKRFMTESIGTRHIDHRPRPDFILTPAQSDAQSYLSDHVAAIADLDTAKTILLLDADPSSREPVMELRIRLAANRHDVRLVVVGSDEIALTGKAHASLLHEPGRVADVARALTAAISGNEVPDVPGASSASMSQLASEYLGDGPVVLLYDDTFPGVGDKGDALLAIAGLARALAGRGGGVIPMLDKCNSMGARDLGVLPQTEFAWSRDTLDQLRSAEAAILVGADIAADPASAVALERVPFLVAQELFMTETARLADVVLPAASSAEKSGTFTNTERRVQRVFPAVPSPGIARPDWQILVDLSQYFDTGLPYNDPGEIWDDIRRAVPAYSSIGRDDIGLSGARPGILQAV